MPRPPPRQPTRYTCSSCRLPTARQPSTPTRQCSRTRVRPRRLLKIILPIIRQLRNPLRPQVGYIHCKNKTIHTVSGIYIVHSIIPPPPLPPYSEIHLFSTTNKYVNSNLGPRILMAKISDPDPRDYKFSIRIQGQKNIIISQSLYTPKISWLCFPLI